MRKNNLGERMKEYERTSDVKLTRRLPMIIRLDGKAFHSWTKKSGCVRPFDHRLMDMMSALTRYLTSTQCVRWTLSSITKLETR